MDGDGAIQVASMNAFDAERMKAKEKKRTRRDSANKSKDFAVACEVL